MNQRMIQINLVVLKISGSIEIDSFGDNNVIIGSGSGEVLSSGTHNIICDSYGSRFIRR